MTCDCVSAKPSFGVLLDLRKFELGPAYEPYKRGEIHVAREFRQNVRLPKLLLPSCCNDEAFDVSVNYPELHFSLLALWMGISTLLFVFYWPKRNNYPLNFRSPRTLLVFWATCAIAVTLISLNAAAGLTAPCHLYLIVMQITFPIHTFYFTIKSLQLAFVYNWSHAKMSNKHKLAKQYHKFKFLLSDSPFLIGVGIFLTLGVAIHVTEMTALQVYSPTLNGFSSIRAYWWRIPEEYRAPTGPNGTRGGMCSCWDLFEVASGDISPAQLNMTYNEIESACTSAYLQDCISNTECFKACPPSSLSSSSPSSSCKSWFTDYYSSGTCGYPALFPSLSSSLFCFGVYRPLFYFYCFLYLFLLLINLTLALSVLRMDDQLYMRGEVLFSFFNGVPCVVIILLEVLSCGVREEFIRFLPNYLFDLILFYYLEYMALFHNIGFPIVLAYYHAWADKVSDESGQLSEGRQRQTRRRTILDSTSHPFPYEDELIFALNNEAASQCYTTFAWKEFTVENIKFLQAVKVLVDQSASIPLHESALHARQVFHMYIEEGSPFEVNISFATRNIITRALTGGDTSPRHHGTRSLVVHPVGLAAFSLCDDMELERMYPQEESTPDSTIQESPHEFDHSIDLEEYRHYNIQPPKSRAQLLEWFEPAVQEIKCLIMRDSWPRFRKSPFFGEFRELLVQQEAYDSTVGSMLRSTDQRRSSIMTVETSVPIGRPHRKRNSSSVESTFTAITEFTPQT